LLVVCGDKEGKGIEAYGERWQIETLFGCLKSKGSNLEDTHMTAPAKIDRLMSVLAIGFVLSCRVGGSRRQTAINQGEEAWQACAKFIPGGVGPAGFCVIQGDEAVGDIRR